MFNEKVFLENYILKGYADEVVLKKAVKLYPEFIRILNKSEFCINCYDYNGVFNDELNKITIKGNDFYYYHSKLNVKKDIDIIIKMLYRNDKKMLAGYKILLQTYNPHDLIEKLYSIIGNVTTFYYEAIKIMNIANEIDFNEFKEIVNVILNTYPTFIEGFLNEIRRTEYRNFINDEILELVVDKYQGMYNIIQFIDEFAENKTLFYSKLRELFLKKPAKYSYLFHERVVFNKLDVNDLIKIKDKTNLNLYLSDDDKKEIIKNKTEDEIIELSLLLGIDFSTVTKNKNRIRSNYRFLRNFYYPLNVGKAHVEKALQDEDFGFLEKYIKQYLLYKEGKLK